MGQGLEGDEEHLGEGEGGTYFGALPENLLVRPDIPEEWNGNIRRELRDGCGTTDEQQPPKMRKSEVV